MTNSFLTTIILSPTGDRMKLSKKPSTEVTKLQLEILFSAVRIARDENVRSLKALQARLLAIWPKKPKSIKAALRIWANHEVAKLNSK